MNSTGHRPLALIGATATGKSSVAMELARLDHSIELISIDSMQVYRGMDIGTAKPTGAEQREVRHHLIDLCDPTSEMSIVGFAAAYQSALADIVERGKRPVLVGGTGLYLRAVVDGFTPPPQYPDVVAELETVADTEELHDRLKVLDATAANRMEPTNRRRVIRALSVSLGSGRPFSAFGPGMNHYPEVGIRLVGIDVDRGLLDARISDRYDTQMRAGFLEEVRGLIEQTAGLGRTARQALGYKELAEHLVGHTPLDEALELAKKRTRRFARRQQRWFRRDPRIEWLHHTGDLTTIVEHLATSE